MECYERMEAIGVCMLPTDKILLHGCMYLSCFTVLHYIAGVPTSEFRARKILSGLGFTDNMMENPTAGLRYTILCSHVMRWGY